MKQFYMVEFDLPEALIEEFSARISEQQKQIDLMMTKGIVQSYSLSQNRSKLFLVAGADSEFEIMRLISTLPLSNFMIPSIMPLMFHCATQTARAASLN